MFYRMAAHCQVLRRRISLPQGLAPNYCYSRRTSRGLDRMDTVIRHARAARSPSRLGRQRPSPPEVASVWGERRFTAPWGLR